MSALLSLQIEGASFEVRARQVVGRERAHEPFRVEVTGRATGPDGAPAQVDAEALLGAAAEIALGGAVGERRIRGVLDAVEALPGGHRFVVVHASAALALSSDHRVFVDRGVLDIVRAVLDEHGLEIDDRTTGSPPARAQCVQAFETDLAFVSRILAEDGITWYPGAGGQLVLTDHAGAHEPIEGDEHLPYGAGEGDGLVSAESIHHARLERLLQPDKVTVRDHDFENPVVDLTAEQSQGDGRLEHYEHPGRHKDPGAGKARAAVRLAQLRARTVALRGLTTSRRLAPGATFTLDAAPRDDMNARWLVVELDYEGGQDDARPDAARRFEARFVAVPASAPYRVAPATRPTLGGIQTHRVTGPSGEEIHTDAHGRVSTLFRWDRRGADDETSSQWARVMHPATSGGFALPRMGWEAVVGFRGVSGDEPFVLGRLDNGRARPAEALPGGKIKSALGTPSTPGGGGPHLLRIDDSAGGNTIALNASFNLNEKTTRNKQTSVSGSDTRSVGANDALTVTSNHSNKVDAAQLITVSGNRSFKSGAFTLSAGTEITAIGGTRSFSVGGDYQTKIGGALTRSVGAAKIEVAYASYDRAVSGSSGLAVGGAWLEAGAKSSVTVRGASGLACAAMTIKCAGYELKANVLSEALGAHVQKSGGVYLLKAKGAMNLSLGSASLKSATIVVSATSSLKITGGGGSILVQPGSVTFLGDFTAGGQVLSKGDTKHL